MAKYALVIGIQTYSGHGFENLTKPAEDAEAIAQILEAHGDFNKVDRFPRRWNRDNKSYEVSSDSVTGTELGTEIFQFFKNVGKNEAFLYFSGHGYEITDPLGNNSGYLVASNCSTETVSSTGVSLSSLNRSILTLDCSSIVVLLDCCHAGQLLDKSLITSSLTAFNASDRNYFLATACRSYEKAYEGSEYSLFTAAVIKALQSPGNDGIVRTAKLNQVIDDELRGSGQEPVVLGSGSAITLVTHPLPEKANQAQPARNVPRIRGLSPYRDQIRKGAFRSYLSSELLPYYSRSAHLNLDPAPEGVKIPEETELLQQLSQEDATGLVITGVGGIGKTRLMLEIGHLALTEGWLVFRVKERMEPKSIYELADSIDPSQQVLLLVDYAETQQDFAELVDMLHELNEEDEFQFRYIANCRKTYYSNIRGIYFHQQIDLSPPDEAQEWFERYRYETVRHILQNSGLDDADEYVDLCRETPILAVFLAYLHGSGRDADLAELVGESSFGQWLTKRISLSFQTQTIEEELALLIAQFPLENSRVEHIYRGQYGPLFDKLANDGWIEQDYFLPDDADESWVTIHDVLADQVITHYIDSHTETTGLFVSRLLDFAVQSGSLRSTLYTLQRIVDLPQLNRLDWFSIINSKILQAAVAWRETRETLTRTPLLSISQRIDLLDTQEAIWEGAESEIDFQNALAWFTRQSLAPSDTEVADSQQATLSKWIERSIPHVETVNILLTWGLKLFPERVKDTALVWLQNHPRQFQTHYLLVAWLESGLPTETIAPLVEEWCAQFPVSSHLSFIFKAWLTAGGDKAQVKTALLDWLQAYGTTLEAQFVFKAWLDAGGEKDRVKTALLTWLDLHGTTLEASFVFKAWLDAGGDKDRVETALLEWLKEHKTALDASFVYQAWLNAGGDKDRVETALLEWLDLHGTTLEAQFVYHAWLNAKGDKDRVETALLEWLEEHGTTLEAQFVYQAWLDAKGDKDRVQTALLEWLKVHGTAEEADFVCKAWLEAGGDFSIIKEFAVQWLKDNWHLEEAVFLTKFLASQRDISNETVKNILDWCCKFSGNEDAIWRFIQLNQNLYREELSADICRTARVILGPLVNDRQVSKNLMPQMYRALSFLVCSSHLRQEPYQAIIDSLFVAWLRNPISFGNKSIPDPRTQRQAFFQRMIDLLSRETIDLEADQKHLKKFLEWINLWGVPNKSRIYRSMDYLKYNYPAPELWDIVQFQAKEF